MKRMWHNCLALVAAMAMTGSASAQNDWNQPSAIGSYQSILSRAGYGNQMGSGQQMMQAGVPMQGSAVHSAPMQTVPMQNAPIQQMPMQQPAMQATSMPPAPMQVQGSMMQMQAAPMQNAPIQGGAMLTTPQVSGAACSTCTDGSMMSMGAPMMQGNVGVNGFVDNGYVANSAIYNGVVSGTVGQPMYSGDVCNAPVYNSQVYTAPAVAIPTNRQRSNFTGGIYGLLFQRDYEDNRFLASNPAGDQLFTNDADEQSMNGYALNLASRRCNGGGFEVGYWSLNPGAVSYGISGAAVNTNLRGLDRLTHAPSGRTVFDIYTANLSQTVVRDTDINNFELNMLRNGGTFCLRGNRKGFYEILGGFRWFQFEEQLQYLAQADTGAFPLTPAEFAYTLRARNNLLGLQLGARNEVCISDRFRFFSGVKGGIFNNRVTTRQNIVGSDNITAAINTGASAGRTFDYGDTKNDVAFLGELDFGLLMNLSCRTRLRLGYRALGVSGVALAADQIPHDFSDADELQRAKSNGGLLLGGGYYGLEFCF